MTQRPRYEVRQNGKKFDVFDLGTSSRQVDGLSRSAAERACAKLNRLAPALNPRKAPPALRATPSGPVRATARRLDERKAIDK